MFILFIVHTGKDNAQLTMQDIGPWQPQNSRKATNCYTINYLEYQNNSLPLYTRDPIGHSQSFKAKNKNKSSYFVEQGKKTYRRKQLKKSLEIIPHRSQINPDLLQLKSTKSIETSEIISLNSSGQKLRKKELAKMARKEQNQQGIIDFGLKRRMRMKFDEKESKMGLIFKKIADLQNPHHRQNISLPKIQINIK